VSRIILGRIFDMMSNNIFEEWSGYLFYARTGRGTGRGWCERGGRKMSSRLIKRFLFILWRKGQPRANHVKIVKHATTHDADADANNLLPRRKGFFKINKLKQNNS
jgi:hypothetical protein